MDDMDVNGMFMMLLALLRPPCNGINGTMIQAPGEFGAEECNVQTWAQLISDIPRVIQQ